jgi:protein translocase SecG subunit
MENLGALLPYVQIGLAVLLAAGILLQRSEAGLGSAFGDTDAGAKITKRGFEKVLFNITIVLGVLFVLSVFIDLII